MSRILLVVTVLAWPGLIFVPAPWVLPGTAIGPLPALGYGAGWLVGLGLATSLFCAFVLMASSSRISDKLTSFGALVALATAPLNLWLWALIAVGSFDRDVQLARHRDGYQAMSDACQRAQTLPTMAERRHAVDSLPHPPDGWDLSDNCADLASEVIAFTRDGRCPRSVPQDGCRCGGQEWPKDRPDCKGGALCVRTPGADESSAALECSR